MKKKDVIETIAAIAVVAACFLMGYGVGRHSGFEDGMSQELSNKRGEKWDCAYSDATGFVMCDRTPKYK